MKILIAVDGSEFSHAATQALISQMRPEAAEVFVLRVVEPRIFSIPPQMAPGYAPEQDETLKEVFLHAQESVMASFWLGTQPASHIPKAARGSGLR